MQYAPVLIHIPVSTLRLYSHSMPSIEFYHQIYRKITNVQPRRGSLGVYAHSTSSKDYGEFHQFKCSDRPHTETPGLPIVGTRQPLDLITEIAVHRARGSVSLPGGLHAPRITRAALCTVTLGNDSLLKQYCAGYCSDQPRARKFVTLRS